MNNLTPIEIIRLIKEDLKHGEELFGNAQYALLDKLESATDPEEKAVLKELFDLYFAIQGIFNELHHHKGRSELLKYHEY